MTFSEEAYRFMYSALMEAEKALEHSEVPIGAVVTYKNKIIGRGYNQIETLRDPTAHAEMIAITAAANYLGNWRLNECSIYVSVEPCSMCAGAIVAARITNLFFAVFDPKFGACGSVYNIPAEGKLNHSVNVYSGLLASESEMLMKSFFSLIRSKSHN